MFELVYEAKCHFQEDASLHLVSLLISAQQRALILTSRKQNSHVSNPKWHWISTLPYKVLMQISTEKSFVESSVLQISTLHDL